MAVRVKTIIWILVALAVVAILGIFAMAGAGFYFFSRNVKTSEASPATAASAFDEARARFPNQKPMIELDDNGNVRNSHVARERPADVTPPEALHVLAYDPDDARVVRLTIPFWLLRLKSGNQTINFNGNDMDLEDLKISVEDLERMGPTLIVDHKAAGGDRVLVWSQ